MLISSIKIPKFCKILHKKSSEGDILEREMFSNEYFLHACINYRDDTVGEIKNVSFGVNIVGA